MLSDHSGTQKTILILGSSGQLGQEFQSIHQEFPSFQFVFATRQEVDILDGEKIRTAMRNFNPSIIINCAAYTNVEEAETNRDLAFSVNEKGPRLLAEACSERGTLLVHISTDYVFDGAAQVPYTEQDETRPLNVYGASKLAGEQAIAHTSCPHLIIRTSWLYSTYGKNFFLTMKKLAKEKKELSVVDDQLASPTYAADLAQDLLIVLSKYSVAQLSNLSGIYHYTQLGICSWYNFASEILKHDAVRLLPVDSSAFPTKAKRPKFSKLDTIKWETTFHITPKTWSESLITCMQKFETSNK